MQKAGASSYEIFQLLSDDLKKFSGGMERDMDMVSSAINRLQNAWSEAKESFGSGFIDAANFSDNMDKATKSTEDLKDAFHDLGVAAGWITSAIIGVSNAMEWMVQQEINLSEKYLPALPKKGVGKPSIGSDTENRILNPFQKSFSTKKSTIETENEETEEKRKSDLDAADAARKRREQFEYDKSAIKDFYETQKELIQDASEADQKAHEKKIEQLKEQAELAKTNADELRKMTLDKGYRKEKEDEWQQAQKDEMKFQRALASAQDKIASYSGSSFSPGLNKKELYALETEKQRQLAGNLEKQANEMEKQAQQAQINSEQHLKNIDAQIQQLMAMK
jgi:hypothetical protein